MNATLGRPERPAHPGARPATAGLPARSSILAGWLLVSSAAAALEPNCRIQTPASPVERALQPGHRMIRGIELRCGGAGDEICSELRGAFIDKRLPRISPERIRAACKGEAQEAWLTTWANVVSLQQGHDATDSKRAEAEAVFEETLKHLFRFTSGKDSMAIENLKDYYLNKIRVLSSEQDAAIARSIDRDLQLLRESILKAGAIRDEELGLWARIRERIQALRATPGAGASTTTPLLRWFEENLAPIFDVEEFVRTAKLEGAARDRFISKDGLLTAEGERVAEMAKEGRRHRLAVDLERVRAALAEAEKKARAIPGLREHLDQISARAEHAAADLKPDVFTATAAALPPEAAGEYSAAPAVNCRKLPNDIPNYLCGLAPHYSLLLSRLYDSPRGRMLRTADPPRMIPSPDVSHAPNTPCAKTGMLDYVLCKAKHVLGEVKSRICDGDRGCEEAARRDAAAFLLGKPDDPILPALLEAARNAEARIAEENRRQLLEIAFENCHRFNDESNSTLEKIGFGVGCVGDVASLSPIPPGPEIIAAGILAWRWGSRTARAARLRRAERLWSEIGSGVVK